MEWPPALVQVLLVCFFVVKYFLCTSQKSRWTLQTFFSLADTCFFPGYAAVRGMNVRQFSVISVLYFFFLGILTCSEWRLYISRFFLFHPVILGHQVCHLKVVSVWSVVLRHTYILQITVSRLKTRGLVLRPVAGQVFLKRSSRSVLAVAFCRIFYRVKVPYVAGLDV